MPGFASRCDAGQWLIDTAVFLHDTLLDALLSDGSHRGYVRGN